MDMEDKIKSQIEDKIRKSYECDEVIIREKGGFGSLVRGLLFGGLIGAAIALLSAPRTGIETREMLRERGNAMKDRASSTIEDTKDRARQVTQRGKDVLNEQTKDLKSTATGVKKGIRTYKEESQSNLTTLENDLSDRDTDWNTTTSGGSTGI